MQSTGKDDNTDDSVRDYLLPKEGKKVVLTDNDFVLFKLLLEFRMLDANQIMHWMNKVSDNQKKDFRKRLKNMFYYPNRYIDRLPKDESFITGGGTRPHIYALAEKGRDRLFARYKDRYRDVSVRVDNKRLSRNHIDHEVLVAEDALNIFQGCLSHENKWTYELRGSFFDQICTEAHRAKMGEKRNNRYGWPVPMSYKMILPNGEDKWVNKTELYKFDYIGRIYDHTTQGRAYLINEDDRGTEPVVRRSTNKEVLSDVHKKIIAAHSSSQHSLLRNYFGITEQYFWLFTATSEKRLQNMIDACDTPELRGKKNLKRVLFATMEDRHRYGFLDTPWRNGYNKKIFSFRNFHIRPPLDRAHEAGK